MNHRASTIEDPMAGTCEWLFTHDVYKDWASSNGEILWIKGLPGSGKSTSLRHILVDIESTRPLGDDAVILSFYYHGRGGHLQRSPVGLYRSLLFQLGQIDGAPASIMTMIMDQYKRSSSTGDVEWHLADLQRTFKLAVRAILETRPVWLFVDALDESGRDNAVQLINTFHFLLKYFQRQGLQGFHVCFTGRHYPLQMARPCKHEIHVERENSNDITTFVNDTLQLSLHEEEAPIVMDMITKRARGVFLWAWLVVREIQQECSGATLQEMEAVIIRTPKELDDIYRQLIPKMKTETLRLMQWVCFAEEPMTMELWRWASVVGADCRYKSLQECAADQSFCLHDEQLRRRVRDLSCGLIEVTRQDLGSGMEFIHQTTKDFFITHGLDYLAKHLNVQSIYPVNVEAQYQLTTTCVRYVAIEEIGAWYRASVEINRDGLQEKFPLISYSAKYWRTHARKAEELHDTIWYEQSLLSYFTPEVTEMYVALQRALPKYMVEDVGWLYKGSRLVHIVCYFGLIGPLKELLRAGKAAVFAKDDRGRTPLAYAAKAGYTAAAKSLLDPEEDGLGILRRIGHAQIDIADIRGRTPLYLATRYGHTNMVRLLLERGAQADPVENLGRTPFLLATRFGQTDIAHLLLGLGARVHTSDEHGRSALSWAAETTDSNTVQLMLDRGAHINSVDHHRRTPLSWVAESQGGDAARMVDIMLDNGASLELGNDEGRTPLSFAAEGGQDAVVERLLDRGAVVDARDNTGRTALSWAAGNQYDDVENIARLLDYGAAVDSRDNTGRTPLSWSCSNSLVEIDDMEVLVSHGAAIDMADNAGRTPLSWAASACRDIFGDYLNTECMSWLRGHGAAVDVPDKMGRTPLSWAASSYIATRVAWFFDHGAAANYPDIHGRTPLDWAMQGGAMGDVHTEEVGDPFRRPNPARVVELLRRRAGRGKSNGESI